MPGRIPQTFIDELLTRVDIVDLIDARVPLKKRGKEFWACCPFHSEKSPSFSVSQIKQFYHCFGCGAHGTAISFLMEYDHMEFPEAIESLAKDAGLEIPTEAGAPREKKPDELYEVLQQCSQWYQQQLKNNPAAIEYLKQRGIDGATAKHFAIGFAPEGWDLLQQTITVPNKTQQLFKAGMSVEKDNGGYYDRFRYRMMFPIKDRRGRIIAFGARVIRAEDQPKYLNSPETPLYHKGHELYGLYEARQANHNPDYLLIVEGYMDVIALAQHGLPTAVATLGTAIAENQVETLFRTSRHLVFCFDGDSAGQKAAWKALECCLPNIKGERTAAFLFLPDGDDPDSYIQKHSKEQFTQAIAQAKPLSRFLLDELKNSLDLTTVEGRSQLLDRLRPLYQKLNDEIFKQQLMQQLAQETKSDEETLARLLRSQKSQENRHKPSTAKRSNTPTWTPTRLAICLLLQQPSLVSETATIVDALASIKNPGIELLLQLIRYLEGKEELTTAAILEAWRNRDGAENLNTLASWSPPLPDDNPDGIKQMLADCFNKIKADKNKQRKKALLAKAAQGPALSIEEKQELSELFNTKK
ncbi:MAG: DNA primase [Gammaproteobacteria bacterium]|nr:DNA primase [Gammaproteobacteria bacterium]